MAGCASAPDAFTTNRVQAIKDSRAPEAAEYERRFYPAIGPDLANLLRKCTADFPDVQGDSFELVFRVDHFGEPKAVLVNPVTDLSTCVATGFWYFTFPLPDGKFAQQGLALLLPVKIR